MEDQIPKSTQISDWDDINSAVIDLLIANH